MMQGDVFEISKNWNILQIVHCRYLYNRAFFSTLSFFLSSYVTFSFAQVCHKLIVALMIAFALHGCILIFSDYSRVGPLCTLQVPGVFCGARPISTRALVERRIGFEHPSLCPHTVWSWTKDVCRLCFSKFFLNTTTVFFMKCYCVIFFLLPMVEN